ncbi:MAG: O-antigen ligase family protein [Acidobacteriota bacterium]
MAAWCDAVSPGAPLAAAFTDGPLFAFVAGAALRLAWASSGKSPSRLAAPAVILAAAVLTSTVVELHQLQRVSPRDPILPELWQYLATDYWTAPSAYPVLNLAFRWLAWLGLAICAERIVADSPVRERLAGAWLGAGVVAAILTGTHTIAILLRSAEPSAVLVHLLSEARISVLQPDVNAAGSHFALFLLPAVVLALRGAGRSRLWPTIVVALVGLAFLAARSRAAIGAVILVAVVAWVVRQAASGGLRRALLVAIPVALVLLAAVFVMTGRSNVPASTALQYRHEMTVVALRAIERYPMFGVGLGDYARTTRRLYDDGVPLLQRAAPDGENAHNNLLQIAVELGLPAAAAFLWLVLPAAAIGLGRRQVSAECLGMSLGLAAFLASALLGHPLLVPQVGVALFLALGLTAGLDPARQRSGLARDLGLVGVVFYLTSLVWRLA